MLRYCRKILFSKEVHERKGKKTIVICVCWEQLVLPNTIHWLCESQYITLRSYTFNDGEVSC